MVRMKTEDIRGTVHVSMFWRSSQRGQTEFRRVQSRDSKFYQQKDAELGTAGGLGEEQRGEWWLTWRRNMKVVGVREEDAV